MSTQNSYSVLFLQYLLIKKKTQVQNVSVFELTIEMNMYTLCSLNSWNIFLNWDLNFKCYLGYISYQEFIAFDLCSDKCACCAFLNCAINERLQTRLLWCVDQPYKARLYPPRSYITRTEPKIKPQRWLIRGQWLKTQILCLNHTITATIFRSIEKSFDPRVFHLVPKDCVCLRSVF